MRIPPIRLGASSFEFETARGPERLRIRPQDIVVMKRHGYVEVQSAVTLY
jgi:hypothetical protein